MPNVIVVAILQAKPGSEETALAVLTETLEATHAEEGCRTYALHVSTQDPTQFVLVERWDDQEALDGHFGQPHMAKLAGAAHRRLHRGDRPRRPRQGHAGRGLSRRPCPVTSTVTASPG